MPSKRLNSFIDNGYYLEGITHTYLSSPPSKRRDGSPLVVNDRYENIITGERGFWNGTHWLSSQYFITNYTVTNISATSAYTSTHIYPFNSSVFVETMGVLYNSNLTADVNNYWSLNGDVATSFGSYNVNYSKIINSNKTIGMVETFTINTVCYVSGGSLWRYQFGKTGSPSNLTANVNLKYRIILQ